MSTLRNKAMNAEINRPQKLDRRDLRGRMQRLRERAHRQNFLGKRSAGFVVTDVLDLFSQLDSITELLRKFSESTHAHAHTCSMGPDCDICDCGLKDVKALAAKLLGE